MAPLRKELEDENHGKYFAFMGDLTKRCNPHLIDFTIDMLQETKAKTETGEELKTHFNEASPTPTLPINNTEGEQDFTCVVMIPPKWEADIIYQNPTPYAFMEYIVKKQYVEHGCGGAMQITWWLGQWGVHCQQ